MLAQEILPGVMKTDIHVGPIIETGPFEMFVVDLESERRDKMERGVGCRTEPGDASGILRNLGLE